MRGCMHFLLIITFVTRTLPHECFQITKKIDRFYEQAQRKVLVSCWAASGCSDCFNVREVQNMSIITS